MFVNLLESWTGSSSTCKFDVVCVNGPSEFLKLTLLRQAAP